MLQYSPLAAIEKGGGLRLSLWKIYPKNPISENGPQMSPGPLGADPGLTRPVEMHSSRRETPSSALTASNGRPKIRKFLQSDSLDIAFWRSVSGLGRYHGRDSFLAWRRSPTKRHRRQTRLSMLVPVACIRDCNFNKASHGGDWEVGRGGSGPSNAPQVTAPPIRVTAPN